MNPFEREELEAEGGPVAERGDEDAGRRRVFDVFGPEPDSTEAPALVDPTGCLEATGALARGVRHVPDATPGDLARLGIREPEN